MTEKFKKNQHVSIKKSRIGSLLLGLFTTFIVLGTIILEADSRSKGIKSPEQWYGIMKSHPYERKLSDLRSPCPMVNTLANHGFLPRDGRDVKPSDIYNVLSLLRIPPVFSVGIIAFAYSKYNEAVPDKHSLSQFGFTDKINLNQLSVYDVLEHDVSLTRHDTALPPHNTTYPVPELVERMIRLVELNNTKTENKEYFTFENEHDARKLRWLESTKHNPLFHYPLFLQIASSFECNLLLNTIGRHGRLRVDHLESILLHERFPNDWYPPTEPTSLSEILFDPLNCWKGLRSSKVNLNLLQELK
ncbi:hypothetical protein G6F57_002712 [Rhizopus arrhizus]|uniref:Heme haloperoxidase family profile domain-containing protein n=1 Tax=Rhizopus oryzae TaxID=64495 RepID=A0A9P6XG61_RHIOR|nr:hypothetical protein G6F24_000846 [Rhizopus arrhizus]KAG0796467.1 hypothetical protein G6F21_001294 [Rhizopus arrhizus]KAG0800745.1 hypothetical protein G6F22_001927 [Rhizopus arrhizus]KAG0820035.1 hypothetical protein G6F20_000275 [Rhizopus arrhizus]KAG0840797.1 hypothetical protein G6F19_001861 [Rhizopus arrhizus]